MKKIKDLTPGERPREKLPERGAAVLSNQELLAVILGKGNRNEDVLSLADIMPLIQHYSDRRQEHFLGISINVANEVMNIRVITIGLVNKTQIHPREVFADALADRASAIIVAHNHPSGSLQPSPEDIRITGQLKEAGTILGVPLLDHIIFSSRGYYSLGEHNDL